MHVQPAQPQPPPSVDFLELLESDEEDDVPRAETQPGGHEALVQGERPLLLARLPARDEPGLVRGPTWHPGEGKRV